ncbi:MAG: FAD-binding protein [Clostridia bacterium]|nr:FAD-binding protein [Clostridia bacterium]MBR2908708.1 FAD-binding protein [Clostridia bacterium]
MEQTKETVYDIAVVGAGPAGAVFVMEIAKARPDLKIVLIDGQSGHSAKPCGGLLAPDAQRLLARFDLALPKSVLEDPQIFAVETIDIGQRLVRYYQRYYLNMDRYAFDRWLISLIPPHVDVRKGRSEKLYRSGDLYGIIIKVGKTEAEVRAKAVVGADGGGSIVRRTFFSPMRVQYIAIQQWFENKGQRLPYYSCIFDAETSDSCSWTIHKGSYVIFGGAFQKKHCRQAFDTQKSRLEAFLGSSFGEAVRTEACLVSSPRVMRDFCTGNEGVFLLGEAAGFISASSFEGLSSAMYSGKMLADAFSKGRSHKDVQRLYRKYTRSLRLKLRMKSVKRALLCTPFTRGLIMRSKIQSIRPYTRQEKP